MDYRAPPFFVFYWLRLLFANAPAETNRLRAFLQPRTVDVIEMMVCVGRGINEKQTFDWNQQVYVALYGGLKWTSLSLQPPLCKVCLERLPAVRVFKLVIIFFWKREMKLSSKSDRFVSSFHWKPENLINININQEPQISGYCRCASIFLLFWDAFSSQAHTEALWPHGLWMSHWAVVVARC